VLSLLLYLIITINYQTSSHSHIEEESHQKQKIPRDEGKVTGPLVVVVVVVVVEIVETGLTNDESEEGGVGLCAAADVGVVEVGSGTDVVSCVVDGDDEETATVCSSLYC
jgi:hypothetical protein